MEEVKLRQTQLHLWKIHKGNPNWITAVQRVMRSRRLLGTDWSSSRKEAVVPLVVGFPREILLVGDQVWLSPEQLVCKAVVCSDSTFFWCSKIKEIRITGQQGDWNTFSPQGRQLIVYCVSLQSFSHTESSHNVWSMIHASHAAAIEKHCHHVQTDTRQLHPAFLNSHLYRIILYHLKFYHLMFCYTLEKYHNQVSLKFKKRNTCTSACL